MTATIDAHGLTKQYGKTTALDGLDLIAQRGQVTAVLGPNGAGKTTFVRMVARPAFGDRRSARRSVRSRRHRLRRGQ